MSGHISCVALSTPFQYLPLKVQTYFQFFTTFSQVFSNSHIIWKLFIEYRPSVALNTVETIVPHPWVFLLCFQPSREGCTDQIPLLQPGWAGRAVHLWLAARGPGTTRRKAHLTCRWHRGAVCTFSSQVCSSSSSSSHPAEGHIALWSSCAPARFVWCRMTPMPPCFPGIAALICDDYSYFTDAFPHLQSAEEIKSEKSTLLSFPRATLKVVGLRCQLCNVEPW